MDSGDGWHPVARTLCVRPSGPGTFGPRCRDKINGKENDRGTHTFFLILDRPLGFSRHHDTKSCNFFVCALEKVF